MMFIRTVIVFVIIFTFMVITGGILGALAGLLPNYRILQNYDICLLIAVVVSGISSIFVVRFIDRKLGITKEEHTNPRTQIWAVLVGTGFAIICLVIFILLTLLFSIIWDALAGLFPDCRILQYGVLICGSLACICLASIIYLDTKKWRILQRIMRHDPWKNRSE